jgi:RND family efflux transporter MFP subunit
VNLQPIWVIIHVFQDQLSQIQLGQTVRMVTPTRQTVLGKISNLGTVVDPEQRTLAVRVVSENNAGLLKPGMFIQAAIVTGQSQQGHLIIPNSALIDDAGKTLVYVKQGNAFIPTTVQLGKRTAQAVEVLDGLYPGDQIVITGVTQIHAQALLSQNTAKAQKESGSTTTQSPEAGSPPGYDWLTLGGGILLGFATALLGFGGWRWLRRRPSRPGRR